MKPRRIYWTSTAMANVSIKNVPERVLTQLRERAARNHRSLQGELLALVHQAVEGETPRPMGTASGTVAIEEIAAEHRTRVKEPLAAAPLAVDIIRSARDAR